MFFKYAEFKSFIDHLKNLGPVIPLSQWDYSSPAIIMRHDVDFDIDAAYELAIVEKEKQIRSTFFVMATCHTYNPFSASNRDKLHQMSAMGFEIALHFDPMIHDESSDDELKEFVDQEATMLSQITGKPVESVSLHTPSIHGRYPLFPGYHNAYDKRIFADDIYLSDSRMDFGKKDPYAFVEKVKECAVQILLHPMHYTQNGLSYPEIFTRYMERHAGKIDGMFRVNSTYVKQLPNDSLFAHICKQGHR